METRATNSPRSPITSYRRHRPITWKRLKRLRRAVAESGGLENSTPQKIYEKINNNNNGDNEDNDHITVEEIEIYLPRERTMQRWLSSRALKDEETLKFRLSSSSTSKLPTYGSDYGDRLRLALMTVRKLGGIGKATVDSIFETVKNDFPDLKDELSIEEIKRYWKIINMGVFENRPNLGGGLGPYEETLKSRSFSSSSATKSSTYVGGYGRRLCHAMVTVRKLGGTGKATVEAVFETMKNDFPQLKDELSLEYLKNHWKILNAIENSAFGGLRPYARFFAVPGVVAVAENEIGGVGGPMRRARSRGRIGSDPYGSVLDSLKGLSLEPGLDPSRSVLKI